MSWLNCCTITLLLCFFTGSPALAEDSFEFRNSESGFRFAEIEIQTGLPEGFDAAALKHADSNSVQEFFWLRYGDDSSRAICLRFDSKAPAELFVDSNRDQKLTAAEQHTADSDGIWFVELTAEYSTLRRQTSKQRVRIRRDKATSKWYLATAGHRTGKADFGGQLRAAKIEDRNANGLWFDREDRLLVDFNGDNKLNRLTERIPAQGMRKIRDTVYAIAGSVKGDSISLSEVTGSGFITPTIGLLAGDAKVTSIKGQLGSKSGIGIPIESIDSPIEVPVGDWHVESLIIEVSEGDSVYMFAFAPFEKNTLVSVADTEKKEVELLGEIELSAGVSIQQEDTKSFMTLTPIIKTESGCFMMGSKTGKRSPINENRVVAHSSSPDRDLEVGSSGFS